MGSHTSFWMLRNTRKIISCVLSSIAMATIGLASIGSDSDDAWIACVHRTSDTEQVLPKVKAALAMIPDSIKTRLKNCGLKIVITPAMSYGKQGNDWEKRSEHDLSSDENIAGQYSSADNTIYVPEKCSWRNEPPRLQGDDLVHVFLHEFGHAYDFNMNHISQTEPFTTAYQQDFSRMSNSARQANEYYTMQDAATNATESFAELFATICATDNSSLRRNDQSLYNAFPHFVSAILSTSSSLHPHDFAGGRQTATYSNQSKNTARSSSQTAPQGANAFAKAPMSQENYYESVIVSSSSALNHQPQNLAALKNRGYAYLTLGKYAAALADFSKAHAINPNDSQTSQYLQYVKKILQGK